MEADIVRSSIEDAGLCQKTWTALAGRPNSREGSALTQLAFCGSLPSTLSLSPAVCAPLVPTQGTVLESNHGGLRLTAGSRGSVLFHQNKLWAIDRRFRKSIFWLTKPRFVYGNCWKFKVHLCGSPHCISGCGSLDAGWLQTARPHHWAFLGRLLSTMPGGSSLQWYDHPG